MKTKTTSGRVWVKQFGKARRCVTADGEIQMLPVAKRLYTIAEVMEMTGMKRTFIYERIDGGTLKVQKMGASTRITSESVEALIANGFKRHKKRI